MAMSLRQAFLVSFKKGERRTKGFLRDVQEANLMVLREFDRVCKARGLVYMLYGGTLLGACRHAGIIPWDDDIDIIMPREHYEKIIDAFNAETANPALRAKLVSPSRGAVFIKIEAIGEPMVYIDVCPCDCYAGKLDQALRDRLEKFREEIFSKVLPDKNPAATYKYYADFRNSLGLTPVAHDDPGCGIVLYTVDLHGGFFIDSKVIFPHGTIKFEGHDFPAPANAHGVTRLMYERNYMHFPLHMRSHFQSGGLTIDRMLNVKRFLRSDSIRATASIVPGRAAAKEWWGDRLVTFFRNAVSPLFNVITHDTLKEYRIFSRKVFRLRAARVIRGRLEAVESYCRLTRDEEKFPLAQGGARQTQLACVDALARVLRVCEDEGLNCWLWLGSLLGAVRNGSFRDVDKEAILLMPRADYERFRPLFTANPDADGLQAKLIARYGGVATAVARETEGASMIIVAPCDFCPDDWDRSNYARCMVDAANQAEVAALKGKSDLEGLYRHYAACRERMGIGMEKDRSHSVFPAWDCPGLFGKSHVLPAKYYAPAVKRAFEGLEAGIPADHDMVLTSLYGDYQYDVSSPSTWRDPRVFTAYSE